MVGRVCDAKRVVAETRPLVERLDCIGWVEARRRFAVGDDLAKTGELEKRKGYAVL